MQPYYLKIHSERRRFWFRIKVYLGVFILLLLGTGGIYFFRESPYFKVKSIEILGIESESREKFLSDLQLEVFKRPITKFLGSDNIFSWPREFRPLNLGFASIVIDKDWLKRSIVANVEKRERLGIWCAVSRPNEDLIESNGNRIFGSDSVAFDDNSSEERCWWFDKKDGLLIQEAPDAQGQLIFTITEDNSDFLDIGSQMLDGLLFDNFRKLLKAIKELDLSVKNLMVDRVRQEFKIITNQGAAFIFSLRFDATTSAVPALKELLKKNPLETINYVDLTVENKIYLKTR